MHKVIYYFLLSLGLVFLNQSIVSALIPPENINILLTFLVFITFVWGLNLAFIFAISIGFLLNYFSYLPFGTFIIIYLIIIFTVDYLHKEIFINFTYFTNIILIVISTLLYTILLFGANFLFYIFGLVDIYILFDSNFAANLFLKIFNNIILISIIFVFAKAIFKRLNLTILIKR